MTIYPICCVAGKSGGHILPCLEFAKQQIHSIETPMIFISTTAAIDKKIISQFPNITNHLELHLTNIPYRSWWKLPHFIFSFTAAIWKSFWYLKKQRPSLIVSTGGFISIPVCITAWLLSIPIHLFELNAIPGKATTVLKKLATKIFICFAVTQKYFKQPCIITPYPLRFTEKDRLQSTSEARNIIGFESDKKTLLILGGSQGSHFLNNIIQKLPNKVLRMYQIIHQTGSEQVSECTEFYVKNEIVAQVFAYRENLAPYYQAADVIICRAGAGTLFEALFFKKKTIVIPLETVTTDHQRDNAYAMQTMHPESFSVLLQYDVAKAPHLLLNQFLQL